MRAAPRRPDSALAWHFLSLLFRNKDQEIGTRFIFAEGPAICAFVPEDLDAELETIWEEHYDLGGGEGLGDFGEGEW